MAAGSEKNERSDHGAWCGLCARPVPADQMESRHASLLDNGDLPLGDGGPLDGYRKMRHRTCGGVFRAPDAPAWIGVRGQGPVATGSWRSRFGIMTTPALGER